MSAQGRREEDGSPQKAMEGGSGYKFQKVLK